jgi:hypothetical protein
MRYCIVSEILSTPMSRPRKGSDSYGRGIDGGAAQALPVGFADSNAHPVMDLVVVRRYGGLIKRRQVR